MILPEVVYRLSDKDLSGQLVEMIHLNDTQSVAAISLSNSAWYTVPLDRILIVHSLMVTGVPGAGQTYTQAIVAHNRAGMTEGYIFRSYYTAGAGVAGLSMWSPGCGYWVPSGGIVRYTLNFSAGAVANGCSVSLSGLLIPRGNVVI